MQDYHRHHKSIWHRKSRQTTWKTKSLWYKSISNYLFRSSLSNRTQFSSINGFNSDWKTVKYGVPEGSVLGPSLFLIFINDLNSAKKEKNSETFHFANDTCLLNIKDSFKKINKVVNKDLKFLIQWLHANKIYLNVTKTEVIFQKNEKTTWLWSEF